MTFRASIRSAIEAIAVTMFVGGILAVAALTDGFVKARHKQSTTIARAEQ